MGKLEIVYVHIGGTYSYHCAGSMAAIINEQQHTHTIGVCVCVRRGIILKNPANGKTMICEVKPLQGKSDQAKQRHIQNMTVSKLMINKNTHTCVLEVTGIMLMLMAECCHDHHECTVKGQDSRPAVQLLYTSLYTSLYSAMASILCLHVRHHIKVATELHS